MAFVLSKQKTADEMRMSDGSSVVCPSDLLEQQVMAFGVDLREAQHVADHRVRGTAAALAEDLFAAREFDDVIERQKKRLVLLFCNQCEFLVDRRANRRRTAARPTQRYALLDQVSQPALDRKSTRLNSSH